MEVLVNDYDSQVYRKLFEFVEQEGLEPLILFIKDYEKSLKEEHLTKALLEGKHDTLSFVKKHRAMAAFLRNLKTEDKPCFLKDWNFPKYVESLTDADIPFCIERARCLEELRIGTVRLLHRTNGIVSYETMVFYGNDGEVTDIYKQYSNGLILYRDMPDCSRVDNYDAYKTSISFNSAKGRYVLNAENHASGFQYRYADVSDFSFDVDTLPSYEEMASYLEPQTLIDSKVLSKK